MRQRGPPGSSPPIIWLSTAPGSQPVSSETSAAIITTQATEASAAASASITWKTTSGSACSPLASAGMLSRNSPASVSASIRSAGAAPAASISAAQAAICGASARARRTSSCSAGSVHMAEGRITARSALDCPQATGTEVHYDEHHRRDRRGWAGAGGRRRAARTGGGGDPERDVRPPERGAAAGQLPAVLQPRRGRAHLGCGRQRVHRLPLLLRADSAGPRAPLGGSRRRRRAGAERLPQRARREDGRAGRAVGRDHALGGLGVVRQERHRRDGLRGDDRPRGDGARHDSAGEERLSRLLADLDGSGARLAGGRHYRVRVQRSGLGAGRD